MSFFEEVVKEIVASQGNDFDDNWDHASYKQEPPIPMKKRLKLLFARWINRVGLIRKNDLLTSIAKVDNEFRHFSFLYDILSDRQSKNLLVKLLCFRKLGHRKVKLPLNNHAYWEGLSTVDSMADKNDKIEHMLNQSSSVDLSLYKFNLAKIGYPIQLYFTSLGVLVDYVIKQYEYKSKELHIKAPQGGVVIDGGGCWGDTAVYFSHLTGALGKVYSFEFIPFNLEIFRRNLGLNAALAGAVNIVQHPLWSNSATKVYFEENGPASRISLDEFRGHSGTLNTISIDDLVKEKELSSVDFIKLDIEGAELQALQGAVRTIQEFKPTLAVALYHSAEDFDTIPKFLNDLRVGYKFYLSHCTLSKAETVLFATLNESQSMDR